MRRPTTAPPYPSPHAPPSVRPSLSERGNERSGEPATGPTSTRARWDIAVHAPSLLFMLVALFMGVGAFNAQNNLLFFVFGVTLAMLIVAGLSVQLNIQRAEVVRVIEGPSEVGRPATIAYRVRNRSRRFPLFAVRISETAPAPLRARAQRLLRRLSGKLFPSSRPGREPSDGTAAAPGTTQRHGELGACSAFVAYVPPGGTVRVRTSALPQRAGLVELGTLRWATTFPFGITRRGRRARQPGTLLVHHPVLPLADAALGAIISAGRASAGSALHERRDGDEFYGLREYVPGDAMRNIAWRASARHGELRSRVHAAPPRLAVRLVCDLHGLDQRAHTASASRPGPMTDPIGWLREVAVAALDGRPSEPAERPPSLSPADRALTLTGSLAAALLARGCRVELLEVSGRFHVPSGEGQRQLERILDALALQTTPAAGSSAAEHAHAERISDRPLEIQLSPAAHAPASDAIGTAALAGPLRGAARHSATIQWTYEQLAELIEQPLATHAEVA
jgi:uncharacterized protein (DUF58 family)